MVPLAQLLEQEGEAGCESSLETGPWLRLRSGWGQTPGSVGHLSTATAMDGAWVSRVPSPWEQAVAHVVAPSRLF